MLVSDIMTGISLIFFCYSVLWSGSLYGIQTTDNDASIRNILQGSSFGLLLVDIVAVSLVGARAAAQFDSTAG